ncbi:MAG: hypothetical protein ACT4OY_09265 [Alphaproteobacteria bacterium]
MHFRLSEQLMFNTHILNNIKHEKPEPVRLRNLILDPALLEVLNKFGRAGFTDNIVFGGALRDNLRGHGEDVTEIDLSVSFDALAELIPEEDPSEKILQIIHQIPGVSKCEFSKEDPYFGTIFGGRVEAEYKSESGKIYIIDINFYDGDPLSSPQMALMGDAPINSIAMGEGGGVWAHPDFEEHLKNKIYSFLGDDIEYYEGDEKVVRSDFRFAKTAAKIPDLQQYTHYYGQPKAGQTGMDAGGMRIVIFNCD